VSLLEQALVLKQRCALLPTDDAIAAAQARDDKPFLWAYVGEAKALMEEMRAHVAALAQPEPIPVMPAPPSLAGGARIRGYAARWGVLDNELTVPGYFGDVEAAVDAGVPITWSHDTRYPLGRVVEAMQDSVGLYITGQLYPPVEAWQETVHAALLAGAMDGMSYYAAIKHEPVRTARLLEVCVTMYPCNPESRIEVVEPL